MVLINVLDAAEYKVGLSIIVQLFVTFESATPDREGRNLAEGVLTFIG